MTKVIQIGEEVEEKTSIVGGVMWLLTRPVLLAGAEDHDPCLRAQIFAMCSSLQVCG